ncbi:hypothetical protein EV201_3219 [Ancylomarina subtilis]|uniref:DprA winged helix domain-containing protein n=1 Tax=Ancylomarina subtilis TaxID=1639035 RepID=A0A4Q7V7C6_9BACT|nr:hypothetical protein [Ancylomarina subtilis]RZT91213.1 hypothetical protein EV201_3219 [Ancylomarina subtilis]
MRNNKILKEEIFEFVDKNQPVGLGEILAGLSLSHFSGARVVLDLIKENKLNYSSPGKKIVVG